MSADQAQMERLQRWATALARRGLATPTLMLLDLIEPLDVIAAQCLGGVAPFLPQRGRTALNDVARLLDDPQASATFATALIKQRGVEQ